MIQTILAFLIAVALVTLGITLIYELAGPAGIAAMLTLLSWHHLINALQKYGE
jgi:hypothetical protein